MTERPILFSGETVRAILSGRKTQTRRLPGPTNSTVDGHRWNAKWFASLNFKLDDLGTDKSYACGCIKYAPSSLDSDPSTGHRVRSEYEPGTKLWIRETWQSIRNLTVDEQIQQKVTLDRFFNHQIPADQLADAALSLPVGTGPQSVLYAADFGEWAYSPDSDLKPWRPSIFMPRSASRITLEVVTVRAERLRDISEDDALAEGVEATSDFTAVMNYAILWDKLNGKRAPWASNPWVWRVEFSVADVAARGLKGGVA